MLLHQHAGGEIVRSIFFREDGDGRLREDRSFVHSGCHMMDRAAMDADAGFQRAFMGMRAGEKW